MPAPRAAIRTIGCTATRAEHRLRCHKVALFRDTALQPVPSKPQDTCYLPIREAVPLDEAQFSAWVRQASRLPGERMSLARVPVVSPTAIPARTFP